jgi:hypothetical protein
MLRVCGFHFIPASRADERGAARCPVAEKCDAHAPVPTFARCLDRERAATFRTLDQMAVERHMSSPVGQVVRSLNDVAAMIGSIAQSRDVAALFVSHSNSVVMRYLR